MNCTEAKELYAAYAIGALEPEERAAVEAHLKEPTHDGCREALRAAEVAAAALADSLPPVAPSPSVWAAIEKQIKPTALPAPTAASTRRKALIGWGVAAAATVALGWVGWSRSQLADELERMVTARQSAEQETTVVRAAKDACARDLAAAQGQLTLRTEAVALLESPSTRVISLGLQAGAEPGLQATAIINLEQKTALLISNGKAAPTQKDFELWVIKGADKRAAGLLRADADRSGTLISKIDPALFADRPDAFAVTLEPEGGGPQPRGTLVLVGAMPKT